MWWAEVIGVVATLFVLASFVCVKIDWIRSVNIIGSIIFVVYGLLIGAMSVWLLNGIMIFVNGYQLYKFHTQNKKDKEVQDDKSLDA